MLVNSICCVSEVG